jgi:hypothetical protein
MAVKTGHHNVKQKQYRCEEALLVTLAVRETEHRAAVELEALNLVRMRKLNACSHSGQRLLHYVSQHSHTVRLIQLHTELRTAIHCAGFTKCSVAVFTQTA